MALNIICHKKVLSLNNTFVLINKINILVDFVSQRSVNELHDDGSDRARCQ